MAKRVAPEGESKVSGDERHQKRQRIENSTEYNSPQPGARANPQVVEVTSAHELQKALASTPSGYRNGIQFLKKFLDSILYSTEEHDLPRKRAILREYLDINTKGARDDRDTEFIPVIFQAWDYAVETDLEALQTQVPAVLALLLKVFSTHPDFLNYGTLLCKATLRSTIIRRLNRNLSAPPSKETIISPLLRLLTEISRYNDGAHAKAVYAKRDSTLEPKILGRNISLWKDMKDESEPVIKRPSVRVNAVRYLLVHLKYQDEIAKADILSNSIIVRNLFDYISTDHSSLIFDILNVMKTHVFMDKTLPRYVKSKILNGKALSHIASLYRNQPIEGSIAEDHQTPDQVAHDFLMTVCTSPAYGVMLPSSGFYPAANLDEDGDGGVDEVDGLTAELSIDHAEIVSGRSHVRNVILAEFIRTLKPHASTLQQELILAIFKALPDLVADYFGHKETFQFDPKLTSTWIGFSSFLYSTIELPVPSYLGAKRAFREHPPAVSVLIQSILPRPLTQQVLSKCLSTNSDLVNFFAVRLLVVAFHKLRAVLKQMNDAASLRSSRSWEYAAQRLRDEFTKRCPPMSNVIMAFRRPSFMKAIMREAITRLLKLYHEIIPQAALSEKFDVSVALCNALIEAEKPADVPEDKAFRIMELEHWIQMARYSPTTRWWQKTKTLPHSPFITLLRLAASSAQAELYVGIKTPLVAVLKEIDMVQMTTQPNALDTVIASLSAAGGSPTPSPQVLDFLDDCCARFIKTPIKYFDDLGSMILRVHGDDASPGPISPLLMTIVQQWPFKGGKTEKGNPAEPLAQWLSKLLYLLKLIGEDEKLLDAIRDSLVESADKAYQDVLRDSFLWKMGKEKAKEALKLATGADFSGSERSSASPAPKAQPKEVVNDIAISLEEPPQEDERHAGLNRWRKKDLDESIDDGDIGELLLCLCSAHTEIRLQALGNIRQLYAKIEATNDPELLQLRIIVGTVLETAQLTVYDQPFPYTGGIFAARAITVISDPAHFLFGKINTFLLKGPKWAVANIPRYFSRVIMTGENEMEGSYHKEVHWYLDYLLDALRTSEDMEIYRSRNMFERLLTYYLSASCGVPAKERILRVLLRAVAVGGSTTLITRCGLVSWIRMRLDSNDQRRKTLRFLGKRLWETCDRAKVGKWSSGTMDEVVALIA
ncbi:ribosome 60S biogenesis N-terminal-domain-containing protein [Dendryphion nanum]|uniref:Ribosome 60S biogenesis N-terminal-domain-containing protein n=1 Tax=Dendryphion nanum TaxID=256645 RepID=A0A9P9IS53_9PLEO|nr:ribosome 60S biogenesis N-terminal-domain-containing protein [Dendryphion nanum]